MTYISYKSSVVYDHISIIGIFYSEGDRGGNYARSIIVTYNEVHPL